MTDVLGIGQLVLGILQQVPEPHVAAVATAIDGIVTAVHQAHVDAQRDGAAPVDLDALRLQIAEAAAAALEPWQRIRDRATGQSPSAMELGVYTGSTGE